VRAFSRIEGFEYVGQVIGGNAGAVVRDSNHDVTVLSGAVISFFLLMIVSIDF